MVRRAARSGGGAWGAAVASSGRRDAVVDLGVEDRERLAVGGELVEVAAGNADDQAVAAQPGEVVAGPVHAVAGAERSGHQGSEALVGEAGHGEQAGAEGAGQ